MAHRPGKCISGVQTDRTLRPADPVEIYEGLDAPFSVPKSVPLVPLQIANKVARMAGMSDYISWYQEDH